MTDDTRELERLIDANAELTALLNIVEESYRELLQAGCNWLAGHKARGGCACGDCAECTLVALIEHAISS